MLYLAPLLVVLLCLIPLLLGLVALVMPSFGFLPGLPADHSWLSAWRELWQVAGLAESIGLTLQVGLLSTALSVLISLCVLSWYWRRQHHRLISVVLSPVLATPHVAFAIGFSFLIAPSGVLIRVVYSALNFLPDIDLTQPPTFWHAPQDPMGLSLVAVLVCKEVPFLLLMGIAALRQIPYQDRLRAAQSLGYNAEKAWWVCVVPDLYKAIRLPVLAVLVYGATVVDLSLLVGPTRIQTLPLTIFQGYLSADLYNLPRTAAMSCLLVGVTGLLVMLWRLIENVTASFGKQWALSGVRAIKWPLYRWIARTISLVLASSLLALLILLFWSFTRRWRFPDMLPSSWSLRSWQQIMPDLLPLISDTLLISFSVAVAAILLTIAMLQYQVRRQRYWSPYLLCLALLIPQLSTVLGIQLMFDSLGWQQYWFNVSWGQLLMVFPYCYLCLYGPYLAYDERYYQQALQLSRSHWRAFFRVKLVMLKSAIAFSFGIGFSVSVAQYLPVQILSEGLIQTVTTEAVITGSGQNRRLSAIYGLIQALLPWIMFIVLFLVNRQKQHDSAIGQG